MCAACGLLMHYLQISMVHIYTLELLKLQVLSFHEPASVSGLGPASSVPLDGGLRGLGSTMGAACMAPQLHEDMLHVSTPYPAAGRWERRALIRRLFFATTS